MNASLDPAVVNALGDQLEAAVGRMNRRRRRHRLLRGGIGFAALAMTSVGVAAAAGIGVFGSSGPSASKMSVFKRPAAVTAQPTTGLANAATGPIPADVLAQMRSFVADEPASDPDAMKNGTVLPASAGRVLLSLKGKIDVTVYAIPTSKGRVCYVMTGADAAYSGCISDFTADDPLQMMASGIPGKPNSAWIVSGFAADEVQAITVESAKSKSPTYLRNNAFVWKSTSVADYPTAVDVTLTDGTHEMIDPPRMTSADCLEKMAEPEQNQSSPTLPGGAHMNPPCDMDGPPGN